MRTKRIPIVVLLACLFSILTNDALAFYNPQTGRWLSRDPLGEAGGANLFEFANNSPICTFDCFGLLCDDCASCDDIDALMTGISGAQAFLENLNVDNIYSWAEFEALCRRNGIEHLGQTSGFLNGKVIGAGKNLPTGQQCLITHFESTGFTGRSNPNNPFPTHLGNGGLSGEVTKQWIAAEKERVETAIAELQAEKVKRKCPEKRAGSQRSNPKEKPLPPVIISYTETLKKVNCGDEGDLYFSTTVFSNSVKPTIKWFYRKNGIDRPL